MISNWAASRAAHHLAHPISHTHAPHANPLSPIDLNATTHNKTQADTIQLSGASRGAVTLRRVTALRVNAVSLGRWRTLDELFPSLESLGPLKETLGPRGYGVNLPLACLEGNRTLRSLQLMVGALRGGGAGGGGGEGDEDDW